MKNLIIWCKRIFGILPSIIMLDILIYCINEFPTLAKDFTTYQIIIMVDVVIFFIISLILLIRTILKW